MKQTWTTRRTLLPTPDGELRWDRAFQLLLRCARENGRGQALGVAPSGAPNEEDRDENSSLCPSVDEPAVAQPDD
jgi:hypothetical protein